jgi:hypothetical protein
LLPVLARRPGAVLAALAKAGAVCTENLNPDVVVMKSAKDHM